MITSKILLRATAVVLLVLRVQVNSLVSSVLELLPKIGRIVMISKCCWDWASAPSPYNRIGTHVEVSSLGIFDLRKKITTVSLDLFFENGTLNRKKHVEQPCFKIWHSQVFVEVFILVPILLNSPRLPSHNRMKNLRIIIETCKDIMGRHHRLPASLLISKKLLLLCHLYLGCQLYLHRYAKETPKPN